MIKNIIFDLGNVLISFKPAEYLEERNYQEPLKRTILSDIFASEEWILLDNAEISIDQAIERIANKSALKKDLIAFLLNERSEILYPLHLNTKLLPELKKNGFRLFYLSNFPFDMWEHVRAGNNGYDFFKYFDGGIISAEVHCSKPDPIIYELLLGKHTLNAEECLFIDDLETNIKTAVRAGMKGFMTSGSTDIYEAVLKVLGG
ncbi:MAG TPA: HAD family phosphatase [Bacteroidales bacterium]|nr:HAD family phosphatase [Bacteroidales bacterium]